MAKLYFVKFSVISMLKYNIELNAFNLFHFRLLLSPLQLGAQAFSWTASMLEPKKIGLPLSPSSTAVRDRVVQAAAKHESQPSDTEESLGLPKESLVQPSENQA